MLRPFVKIGLIAVIGITQINAADPDASLGSVVAAASAGSATSEVFVQPHAGMLRFPDVGASQIVFEYANDLWLVPREGGTALPLASPPGPELFPRFSPDGQTIAFVGNYDGNRDIYTVGVKGGVPFRVTHHPAVETLCDWTPTGDLIFYSSGLAGLSRQSQLYTVSATGGLPHSLPVPYGANGAISTDGQWLAYTPHSIDFRTWKRYRGGMATDIWLFHLKNLSAKKITTWEGTDTYPMWHESTVYYLADEGTEHRLNIWAYELNTEKHRQITKFKEYDVKFPAIGPGPNGEGEMVFQNGADLYLLNLSSENTRRIPVLIPGARPRLRPQRVEVKNFIANADLSPTGKRVAVEARGDIWTLPAKEGSLRNLHRTSGVAERYPAWSPDGRWIAYASDQSGEYEIYIIPADGKSEPRKLTSGGKMWRYSPMWSPDSKYIAYTDKTGSLYILTVETGESQYIDKDPWAFQIQFSWSHDSSWIAYTKMEDNRQHSIWLYHVPAKESQQVISSMFENGWPTFDRQGDFLFFTSNRQISNPIYEDLGTTFVYTNTNLLMAASLRKDVENPYQPKSDEESLEGEKKSQESDGDKKEEKTDSKSEDKKSTEVKTNAESEKKAEKVEIKPLDIDLKDFEKRVFALPIKNGNFYNLAVNHEGKLLYTREPNRGSDGKNEIKIFDLKDEKKEEKTVLAETANFLISADGKKILVEKDRNLAVVDAAPDQKIKETVPTSDMAVEINPREEWRQLFTDAWRIQRDFFYDPNMHSVDWKAVYRQYEKMLADCASRDDLSYVIGEMISELNIGHTYYFGGDVEGQPSTSVGMLGVDFEKSEGAYRIAQIYEGSSWDVDARNPIRQLKEGKLEKGDFLLAVNRIPVDPALDPWAAFLGLADQLVTLTVSKKPKLDSEAHDVVIQLLANEGDLRYRAWIEKNRAYVDKKTGGKVGYIYVPNTSINGQNDLFRQFYGQLNKEALIIDERWNGGGQIPTRFIELLNRPIVNYWARRDGKDWPWPPDAHQGPKCMLINGMAGSGGDAFPAYFKQAGLGKLIGTRTWGGLVGMSGNPSLIDGGHTTVPTFGYYKKNGTWGIEGHGVDPDIEVIDDPAQMVNGGDPQLDAAIDEMMNEIKSRPYTPPARPAYPNRSGMGIREEDK